MASQFPRFRTKIKKKNTTTTVFVDERHRYSIADGIRDGNVLGFAPYKVLTFKDQDLRKAVALEKVRADTVEQALADPKKSEAFNHYMHLLMAGSLDDAGTYIKGMEDYIPNSQYQTHRHQSMVVQDIVGNWVTLSLNGKFHAIFATTSIPEAIEYYRLLKKTAPELKITALFDPSIDNTGHLQRFHRKNRNFLIFFCTTSSAETLSHSRVKHYANISRSICLRQKITRFNVLPFFGPR